MEAAEIELIVLLTDTEISRASGYGHFYNTGSPLLRTVTQAYFPITETSVMQTLDSLYLPRASVLGCITQCRIQTLR